MAAGTSSFAPLAIVVLLALTLLGGFTIMRRRAA